jgi:hypothetical protein
MADALKKRIVCVFYKVEIADFDPLEDGMGPLEQLNVIPLNELNKYFQALRKRIR